MDIAAFSPSHCDLQAALFGGGGAGERARSLHLLQRYITRGHQETPVNDDTAAAAITTAIDTLCTHFLSCVTPNTSAQHLLISAIAAHILPFPTVAAACRRLSSNFAHRNHVISWVHTIVACLRSTSTPQPLQGGRATLQLLILHLLQVCVCFVFNLHIRHSVAGAREVGPFLHSCAKHSFPQSTCAHAAGCLSSSVRRRMLRAGGDWGHCPGFCCSGGSFSLLFYSSPSISSSFCSF